MCAVNWYVSSSLITGVSESKSGTQNEPEQISSTSWYTSVFSSPTAEMQGMQRDLINWDDLSTTWASSLSGECCSYCRDWPKLPQITAILVPISLCTGNVSSRLLPKCPWGQDVDSFFCAVLHNSATTSGWSYPLIWPSFKITHLCCCVSVWETWVCNNLKPNLLVILKKETEFLETQYPKLFFSRLCVKHPWKHPCIHMEVYLIPWGEVTSLSWSASFFSTCIKKVNFLPQFIRKST